MSDTPELLHLNENFAWQKRKSLLARLLAKENIDVHFSTKVTTGMFQLASRTVILPAFKEGISPELLDLLIVHEISHALWTPRKEYELEAKALSEKYGIGLNVAGDIINILEDVRINRKAVIEYPGARSDFTIGYQHRFERGDYGSTDVNELNKLGFIDRINIFAKAGHVAPVAFTAAEQKLLDKILVMNDWQEVVQYANELIAFLKKKKDKRIAASESHFKLKNEIEKILGKMKGGDEGDTEFEGADSETEIEVVDPSDDEEKKEEAPKLPKYEINYGLNAPEFFNLENAKREDETDKEEESEKEDEQEYDDEGLPIYKEGEEPIMIESYNLENAAGMIDMQLNEGLDIEYINLPKASLEFDRTYKDYVKGNTIGEDRVDFVKKWTAETMRHVNFMSSIFEMKKQATAYAKTSIHKTGVINVNQLHKYQLVEDIFKKNTRVPEGKNHGFVFLVDTSDSMSANMIQTRRQAVMMAMFARRIGVPFMIVTFSDCANTWGKQQPAYVDRMDGKKEIVDRVYLSKVFDSDMSISEFNEMAKRWIVMKNGQGMNGEIASGGTPLNTAITAMYDISLPFIQKNRIEIFNFVTITDGGAGDVVAPASYDSSYNHAPVVLNDPETKMKWTPEGNRSYRNGFHTEDCLRILRDRLSAKGVKLVNFVNFYLQNGMGGKVHIVERAGYDKAFTIDPKILSVKKPEHWGTAESYYSQMQDAKKAYRVFLNHFTETVAEGG